MHGSPNQAPWLALALELNRDIHVDAPDYRQIRTHNFPGTALGRVQFAPRWAKLSVHKHGNVRSAAMV